MAAFAQPKTILVSLAIAMTALLAGCATPEESMQPNTSLPDAGDEPLEGPAREGEGGGLDGTDDAGNGTIGPQRPPEPIVVTPDAIAWGPGPASLPNGTRAVALSGDPAAAGEFTLRAEMPANYSIAAHTHRGVERVTILSGSAYLGLGETADRDNATHLPAGSYFEIPPGTPHYFFTEEEGVVLQIQDEGPWTIDYVDEADDPRAQGNEPPSV